MIAKTTDAALVNRIANSDGVREFVDKRGVPEPMDWTPACVERSSATGVVLLTNGEDAVAAFEMTQPGEFLSHTMFAKTCRGRRAVDTGREMVAWMFAHGATRLWGVTPLVNAKARWFNRQIGMTQFYADSEDAAFEIRKAA